jgi:hypothetical protein
MSDKLSIESSSIELPPQHHNHQGKLRQLQSSQRFLSVMSEKLSVFANMEHQVEPTVTTAPKKKKPKEKQAAHKRATTLATVSSGTKSKPRKAHTNISFKEPPDSEPFAKPNSSKFDSALQKLGEPSVLTSSAHQMGLLNAEYKWEAVMKLDIGIINDLHATAQLLLNRKTPGLLSHKLYIKVDNKRNWEPWLQVKESSLPGAGKGIFALREFRKGQVIGWYYGKKVPGSNHEKKPYQFANIDAEGGRGYPGRLGLHFLNDPTLSQGKEGLETKQGTDLKASLKKVNVRLHKDGLALAVSQIRVGDELFAHYQLPTME